MNESEIEGLLLAVFIAAIRRQDIALGRLDDYGTCGAFRAPTLNAPADVL